jgi:hypothetical protein
MEPHEVAAHPSVQAVRDVSFDFRLTVEASATCAACGRRGRARSGETARRPCWHPGACAFTLVVPPDDADGPARGWARRSELRGAIEEHPDGDYVPRQVVPPPPRGGAEWHARRGAVAAMSPGLADAFHSLPIGWFGVVELAAHALDARGLGGAFTLGQAKEKFGTARIYINPVGAYDDPSCVAATAILDWAESCTGNTCARDGAPDGRLGQVGTWWITLGERAWADVARASGRPGDWRAEVLDLYPAWTVDGTGGP